MNQEMLRLRALLLRLANAAEAYRADQSAAIDPRLGLVQPITVAEGRELDEALTVVWKELEKDDKAHKRPNKEQPPAMITPFDIRI